MGTLASGSIDLNSLKVAGEPNKYVTMINGSGIRVHEAGAVNTNFTQINSNGMQIYKGGTADSNIIASFGDTAQIGKSGQSRIGLDYHSLQMVDKDNNPYFWISDLRGVDGRAEITNTFTGDGTENSFYLAYTAINNTYTVTVNDVAVTSDSDISKYTRFFSFTTAPADGATIKAVYTTEDEYVTAYTLGQRGTGDVGAMSIVEGLNNVASGGFSHAEGEETEASGANAHAEGNSTHATGYRSHAEGGFTYATESNSHAEGCHTTASGYTSHAEGYYTTASAGGSHAEGYYTTASAGGSHAEGYISLGDGDIIASGTGSHAEGFVQGEYSIIASGTGAHAEGIATYGNSEASGVGAHVEGSRCTASGFSSHAEGNHTTASGYQSHAEGWDTVASGDYSHAEGNESVASGDTSHASGDGTIAQGAHQTAIGAYNIADSSSLLIIGNGTGPAARANALTVDRNGNVIGLGMAGMVQMFAGSTAPTGWLMCNGQAVSRTTYATLFAVIGTTYGTGDGSTTFNVPDMRGRAPIGVGQGSGLTNRTLGSKTGSETQSLTDANIAHGHGFTNPTYKITQTAANVQHAGEYVSVDQAMSWNRGTINSSSTATYKYLRSTADPSAAVHRTTPTIPEKNMTQVSSGSVSDLSGASSTRTAHNNMQPSLSINFIICTGKTF